MLSAPAETRLSATQTTPRDIPEARLSEFYRYWHARRCGTGEWPRRRDLDPADIPALLPNLMLVEVHGERYRYRLVGTAVTDALGMDPTGRFMDDLPAGTPFTGLMTRIHDAVRQAEGPVCAHSRHVTPYGTLRSCGRVLCPLADEDGGLAMIATCAVVIANADAPTVVDGGGEVVLDGVFPIVPDTEAVPAA
ncbi:PAS domain-containing protein [Limimonas halophila]|uniref:PAS domain-containing protein n=1 Tax=Limimonas halophila TaxID=1082479 RepID=UPI0015A0E18C|nr:PAS domain-containing protein [Limimonas halophila]